MPERKSRRLALVVRTPPYRGRSGRDQLDVAVAAATLEHELELFFIGTGVLQLLPPGHRGAAALPRGTKGWASLPGLTALHAWVMPAELERLAVAGEDLLLDCRELDPPAMAERLAACDRAWVI